MNHDFKYHSLRWNCVSAAMLLAPLCGLFACPAFASEPAAALSFNRDIRPILSDKCFACHGFDAQHRQADLRLDAPEGAYATSSENRVAIKPHDLARSELWHRITSADPQQQMPPPESNKTLSTLEKETLKRWIEQGADYQKHWAFEPLVRPAVPAAPAANPIDALIIARLEVLVDGPAVTGDELAPEADRETLLRRVSLDLTGLPPRPEEIDLFLADLSPDAYEKQVDRLLAAPQYGERMATFWLDVARYGDTNGYLHDLLRTGWPWRDWVIQAFNNNMPFDQFVIEQLAGDLLPGATPQQVLATAFLRNHPITAEGGTIAAEYMNEYSADRVQTVGTAFLGLGFNCCRCHDHKFDPLTQSDFYSLQAYFNSITEKHLESNQASAYPPLIEIPSPLLPDGDKVSVMVMQEAPEPTTTFVLIRGQYDQPDHDRPTTRRPPLVFGPAPTDPQNRLTLARWIVSKENPLLARVTVNRLWHQLFGTGLVRTVEDFGMQGEYPSHPELLDYLAVEFRDGEGSRSAWDVKHLVRTIVTTSTYRQSANVRKNLSPEYVARLAANDPDNRLLSRFPRQRLGAEEVRDQALFAAGLLSPKLGGAPVFTYQPAGLWEERGNEGSNTKDYKRSEGESLYRRSLYTFWKRTCPPPLMTVFDAPDRLNCTARRSMTNTPLQALATLNDEPFLECAKLLAARTLQEKSETRERLTLLFRRATGRSPSEVDLQTLEAGLDSLLVRFRESPADAEKLLQPGATPAPADLDKSELAAWMLMANTVLNLDETLVRD